MKSCRGITLIALIITIGIMLILAGVSIGIAINEDGLIGSAQNAKEQVENQISAQEQWTQNVIDEF